MSDETTRLKLAQLVSLQELNAVTWNEALAALDVLVDLYLNGQYLNDPPAAPSDGDAYLIGGAPTGAWSGEAYKIASCLDGGWRFYTPYNGLRAYVATSGAVLIYGNGLWSAIGSTDFATKSGNETLSNKTLSGMTLLPNGGCISASGTLGIGTTSPAASYHVLWAADVAETGTTINVQRCRGTTASPAALLAGDRFFNFSGGGYCSSGGYASTFMMTTHAEENYAASRATSFQIDLAGFGGQARTPRLKLDGYGHWLPGADNSQNLGSAALRFATVYAGSGTINTSGEEDKVGIRALSAAELAVATALAGDVALFQFAEALARKGEAARLHAGFIYETVVAAFAAQGLDPMRYGIVCRDPALKPVITASEEGEHVCWQPDHDAAGAPKWTVGLRYSELMSFLIAGLSARLAALEAR